MTFSLFRDRMEDMAFDPDHCEDETTGEEFLYPDDSLEGESIPNKETKE